MEAKVEFNTVTYFHRGQKIRMHLMDPSTFFIDWEDGAEGFGERFRSLRDAVEEINKATATIAKRRKLSLPATDGDGRRWTITGLHRGTGAVTARQEFEAPVAGYRKPGVLYPDHPRVAEMLEEQKHLVAQLEELSKALRAVSLPFGYTVRGGGIDQDEYAEALDRTEAKYNLYCQRLTNGEPLTEDQEA